MSMRLTAAAKGLAVGVLTLTISGAIWVAGGIALLKVWSTPCIGTGLDPAECSAGRTSFWIVFGGAVVLFALVAALGALLAWGFLLARPGWYVIPAFLIAFIDIPVLQAGVRSEFLLVAPLAAYPVIAALSAGSRRNAPAPAP
jgi:hypothetical protein